MSLLSLAHWLDASSLGAAIRDSPTMFPFVETFHLLGLSMMGGAVLVVDLRLWGFGTRRPVAEVAKDARPWLIGSLVVLVISGFLMAMSEVIKLYESGPFRIKMVLFFVALIFTFTVHRKAASETQVAPVWGRVVALLSLALWTGVGIAGRAIGFF